MLLSVSLGSSIGLSLLIALVRQKNFRGASQPKERGTKEANETEAFSNGSFSSF